jgi:triosephosphate isomerase
MHRRFSVEKENSTSVETLVKQVKIALHKVPPDKVRQLVIAYEPVWAIGESGVPASPEFADSMQQHVKQTLYELFGKEFGVRSRCSTAVASMPITHWI